MRTRGKKKEGKTQRKMDEVRRSKTKHKQTEEDTRDRYMWKNLVLGGGKPLCSGQSSDE
jgi:hypothetical protein